jgi:hypothetical protein
MKLPKIDGKIVMSAIIAGVMLTIGFCDAIQPLPSMALSKQSKPNKVKRQPKDPNLFEFLLGLLKPKSANGFSRVLRGEGGEFCLLGDSQLQKSRLSLVWNPNIRVIGAWDFTELSLRSDDSRVDLWQGKIATFATTTGQTLAFKPPMAVQTFMLKDAPVFKLGQSYDLIFGNKENKFTTKTLSLQMVSSQEYEQISSELKALERRLNAKKINPDRVLLEKAKYFAQKGLQLDSWQAIYDASQLNPQLQSSFRNLVIETCLPKSNASNY